MKYRVKCRVFSITGVGELIWERKVFDARDDDDARRKAKKFKDNLDSPYGAFRITRLERIDREAVKEKTTRIRSKT